MLSFDNTANAFSGKTDNDLRRSYWLFKMVSNPGLVNFGRGFTDFALNIHLPINRIIKQPSSSNFAEEKILTNALKLLKNLVNTM